MTVSGTLRAITQNRLVFRRPHSDHRRGDDHPPGTFPSSQPGLPACAALERLRRRRSRRRARPATTATPLLRRLHRRLLARSTTRAATAPASAASSATTATRRAATAARRTAPCPRPRRCSCRGARVRAPAARSSGSSSWRTARSTTTRAPQRTQTCIDGDPACDADGEQRSRLQLRRAALPPRPGPRLPACAPGGDRPRQDRGPEPARRIESDKSANGQAIAAASGQLGATVCSARSCCTRARPRRRSTAARETFSFRGAARPGNGSASEVQRDPRGVDRLDL